MNAEMERMFQEFRFNDRPAALIDSVNGMALPADYLCFMSEHNGGEGAIGEYNYGRFYPLEELKEINDEYDASNCWPGYVVIGGIDSNLWAYCPEKGIYCQIDMYGDEDEAYCTIAHSLEEFLTKMDEELR